MKKSQNISKPQKSSHFVAFDAEEFVDRLLEEGSKSICYNVHNCDKCPPFYNEKLYKKGQQFFYKHMFAMFFAKFMGLIAVLSIPSVLKLLILTGKSGTDFSAYLRYMSTVFHMIIWYQDDFEPGSRLWRSVSEVTKKHNFASQHGYSAGLSNISQKDMAFTQFGFMGFQVARSEKIGIHNASEEELKAFIHLWKVVGYLMGIDDRFNICRDSVQETKEICNLIIAKSFYPEVKKMDENFLNMSSHLIRGMWCMNPNLEFKVMMNYLYALLKPSDDENVAADELFHLNFWRNIKFRFVVYVVQVLSRYNVIRWYLNFLQHLSIWLMQVFPFLAFYRFGKANSVVKLKV